MFRKTLVTLCMLFVLLSALSIPAFADYDTIRIYGAVEKLDGTDSRPVYAVMMTEQGGADISAYIICRKGWKKILWAVCAKRQALNAGTFAVKMRLLQIWL